MMAAARRYALTDAQWARIEPLLPGRRGALGVTARDNRLFVEAVLYRYRAGIPWRDLPERFGDFRKVLRRHSRWSHKGTRATVFEARSAEPDNEYAMIDSTIVRCHQHGTGAAGSEKSRGDRTLARRAGWRRRADRSADRSGHGDRRPGLPCRGARDRAALESGGIEVVIPPKRDHREPREYDRHLYRARHLIETFFDILENGCQVEALQLRSVARLEMAPGLFMIVAWRINRMMRLGRGCPRMPASVVFEPEEIAAAYALNKKAVPSETTPTLAEVVRRVARVGGFIGRKSDGDPGGRTIWRGIERVMSFADGLRYARAHPESG